MRLVIAIFLVLGASAAAQQPSIEMRKVHTLVDRDGKGFTRAPMSIAPVGKWFAMTEMNELPIVVDSSGRLVKRWPGGEGPGEFNTNAGPARRGSGDTLYVGNHSKVNVFDRNLKFVRSMTPKGVYVASFLPIGGQFVFAARRPGPGNTTMSLHVVDRSGNILRSFLTDTLVRPQRGPDPEYSVDRGEGETFWAWSIWNRKLQRWSLDGRRLMVIDTTPAWFPQKDPLFKSRIRSVREADGILWVHSMVPVPNARALAEAAHKTAGESDARISPFEQMATAYLEAFDARTGKRLAELHLAKYGIGFVDDRHFMIYTTSANDTAQLEIWEVKLKR